MRLVTFEKQGQRGLGVRRGDEVVDVASGTSGVPGSLDEVLVLGAAGFEAIANAIKTAKVVHHASEIRYLPPVGAPSRVICVGLNYVDHASESPYKDPPTYPVLFSRFLSSYVGHGEPLVRPRVSTQFDYEGELVAVIGKRGRYIPKERALEYVVGYSLFNDGSIRDYQFKSTQWLMGKNFDRTGSFGPELVTADELPAGAVGLQLRTRLNGQVLQDANTRDMIFDIARLVEVCSDPFELQPGDLIVSGTPSGVGFARKPPVFMKHGDVCEVEIDGVGLLSNPIVDEEPS